MKTFSVSFNIISCSPNWIGANGYDRFYNILLMIFGFLFPTMIVLITNLAVCRISNKVNNNHSGMQNHRLKNLKLSDK